MNDILQSKLNIFNAFSKVVSDNEIVSMPNDVKKMLSYDIALDIFSNDTIITNRIIELLKEYNLDFDEVKSAMFDVSKKFGNVLNDNDLDDLDADELFELSIVAEELLTSNTRIN